MPAVYEIRFQGRLPEGWKDWFTGLDIRLEPGGETTLTGCLPDQAALLGLLGCIQAWNITLLLVKRCEPGTPSPVSGC